MTGAPTLGGAEHILALAAAGAYSAIEPLRLSPTFTPRGEEA